MDYQQMPTAAQTSGYITQAWTGPPDAALLQKPVDPTVMQLIGALNDRVLSLEQRSAENAKEVSFLRARLGI